MVLLDFKNSAYGSGAFDHGEITVENTWEKSKLNLHPGFDPEKPGLGPCDATFYTREMLEKNVARAGETNFS